jgi:hypothetical protein
MGNSTAAATSFAILSTTGWCKQEEAVAARGDLLACTFLLGSSASCLCTQLLDFIDVLMAIEQDACLPRSRPPCTNARPALINGCGEFGFLLLLLLRRSAVLPSY